MHKHCLGGVQGASEDKKFAAKLYRAPLGLVNLDSARQGQIEAAEGSGPNEQDHCWNSKASEEDRFGKVAASPNSPKMTERGITLPNFNFSAVFVIFICFILTMNAEEKSIVVVIPSYNNKECYNLNLISVLDQKYDNFHAIYIDDASTDGTGALVTHYLLENDLRHKVIFIQNKERVGALANIYFAVSRCKSSDIIVTLDGDDWLYHDHVFSVLNELYSDPEVWVTYGQYITYPEGGGYGADPLPDWVFEHHYYRDYPWVTTHLRSFYAGLFHKIGLEDLLYEGKFYPVAWDVAFMLPILEMAGPHSRFYPEVLYVYNTTNPLNDFKNYQDLQKTLEKEIRDKLRYRRIDTPY